jgi:hypothetical protein
MPGGFRNQPKILRGAFVEYALGFPPPIVVFQFNPLELSRRRSQGFSMPGLAREGGEGLSPRDFHQGFEDLRELRDAQQVTVQPESLSFDIRLDATDKLNEGDPITEQHGIMPQLATLELMIEPKSESALGEIVDALLPRGFSFTSTEKPPIVLFIWGRKRVLPVNINGMSITETEFDTYLNPVRATVAVELTVIEGPKAAYLYSKGVKEALSSMYLDNLSATDVKDVIIPG